MRDNHLAKTFVFSAFLALFSVGSFGALAAQIIEHEIVDLDTIELFVEEADSGKLSNEDLANIIEESEKDEEKAKVSAEVWTQPDAADGGESDVPYNHLGLDGQDHALTERWRKFYSSAHSQKWITSTLMNGEKYRLYVRKKLAERNMPAILEYLPVIESGYTISARSRSGALGMWQFMENSIKPYLKKNEFIDERLDPWKATEAALSKLQENYDAFGDWAIAIAAYNCGSGAMRRALSRAKEKTYWYLAENNLLSSESINYVPKLLAIADLVENSEFYNMSLPKISEENEAYLLDIASTFDYVTVNEAYSIRRLASEMRLDEATLLELNSALTKGITPPAVSYEIRLPQGLRETAESVLEEMEPWGFTVHYVIKPGDTLWDLARSNNTTVQAICEANGISEKSVLKIGKVLYLPPK